MQTQMVTRSEEAQWLEAARKGDHSAFERIVNAFSGRVAATVKGMLGDGAQAEDVGQEVFISFYRSLERFRGESSLATYLTRIAINLSLNEIKRRKRWFGRSGDAADQELARQADPGENPEQNLRKEMVRAAVRALPERFRAVVVLRLLQEYSTQETAAILGLPLGTVQSRLARAQQKLKERLAPSPGRLR